MAAIVIALFSTTSVTFAWSSMAQSRTVDATPIQLAVRKTDDGSAPSQLDVRKAKRPVEVSVSMPVASSEVEQAIGKVVSQLVDSIDRHPQRLVILDVSNLPLRFAELPRATRTELLSRVGPEAGSRYENLLARRIATSLERTRTLRPEAALSVRGLPFESRRDDPRPSNLRYRGVIGSLDAFVLDESLVMAVGDRDSAIIRRSFPNALRLAGSRAVLFAANLGWMIVLPGKFEDVARPVRVVLGGGDGSESSDSGAGAVDVAVASRPTLDSDGPRSTADGSTSDSGGSGGGSGSSSIEGGGDATMTGGGLHGGGAPGGSPIDATEDETGPEAGDQTSDDSVSDVVVDDPGLDEEVDVVVEDSAGEGEAGGSNDDPIEEEEADDPTDDATEDAGSGDAGGDGWDPSDEVDDSAGGDGLPGDDPGTGDGDESEGEAAGGDAPDDDGAGNGGDDQSGDSGGVEDGDSSSTPATHAGEAAEIEDWETFATLQGEVDALPNGSILDLRGRGFMAVPGDEAINNRGKDIHFVGGHITGATTGNWESAGDGVYMTDIDFSEAPDARMYLIDPGSAVHPRLALYPPAPATRGPFRFSKHSSFWSMTSNGEVVTNLGSDVHGGVIEALRITDPVMRSAVDAAIGNVDPATLAVIYHASSNRMGCVRVVAWDAGTGELSLDTENALKYYGYCNFALTGHPDYIREPGEYSIALGSGRVYYRPSSGDPTKARIPCVWQAVRLTGGSVVFDGMTLSGTLNRGYGSSLVFGSTVCDRVEIRGCHLHSANFGTEADLIEDSVFEWFVDRAVAGRDGIEVRRSIIRNVENNSAVLIQTVGEDSSLDIRETIIEGCIFSIPATAHGNAISLYKDTWQNATVRHNIFTNCERSVAFQPNGNAAARRDFAGHFRFENNLVVADGFNDTISPGQSGFAFNGSVDTHLGSGTTQEIVIRHNTLVVDRTQFPPDSWLGFGRLYLEKAHHAKVTVQGNIMMGVDAPQQGAAPANAGHHRGHNLILRTMPDDNYWGLAFGSDDLPSPSDLPSAFDFLAHRPVGFYEHAAVDGGPVGIRWSQIPTRASIHDLDFDWSLSHPAEPLPPEYSSGRVYFNQDLR